MTDMKDTEPRPAPGEDEDRTLDLFAEVEPATAPEQPPSPGASSPEASRRNGLSPDETERVLHLHGQGLGTRRIAAALGRGRHTIRRALEEAGRLTPRKTGVLRQRLPEAQAKASKLDPFRERIAERVAKGLTVTRILRELREEGYRGGRTILAAQVRSLRAPLAPRSRKVTRRFETEPGREVQVDWSTYRVEIGGRPRPVQALAMVLAHSRHAFLRFYESQRQAALLEGLEAGFRFFHGVTRESLFDNMATVVLGRVGPDRKPLWNPELLAFAQHMGTEPKLCRVAHPDRKGEVEAFLGYAERDFVRGRAAESLPAFNRQAERWLRDVANQRLHGTTGRVPEEVWREEQPFLIALPDSPYPGACELEYRRVAEDCTVSIRGTCYTVPARLAHKQVRVRLYAERFEVLDRAGAVAFARDYAVGAERRRLQLDPEHYADLPRMRSLRSGKTGRLKAQVLARWPSLEGYLGGLEARVNRLLHVHLRRLLLLAERYGDGALEAAALAAHAAGRHTSQAVERILEREYPPREEPLTLAPGAGARAQALLETDDDEDGIDSFGYLDDVTSDGEEDTGGGRSGSA